jgi:hypothetical protein
LREGKIPHIFVNKLNKKTRNKPKQKMTKKKTAKLGIFILLVGILLISSVSAEYFWKCYTKGQVENLCVGDRTCGSDLCKFCMSSYNAAEDCFYHTNLNNCGDAGDCSDFGGGANLDVTPPELGVLSPTNDSLYTSRKVPVSLSVNEISDLYYLDTINGRGRWVRVCSNCFPGSPSYSGLRTFSEGENIIMFKAVDLVDNEAYKTVKFFVDSISPRIYRTYPMRGFANTEFEVQFKEANPKRVTLHYGVDSKNLNLGDCQDIIGGKTSCTTEVNLDKYHGQKIEYYFEVEDIAGNVYSSRPFEVSIDTKDPIVNNPGSFYTVDGRYTLFNISITEENFYKATFIDNNDLRARERTLCTRLINGFCVKRQSFMRGNYSLTIQIYDKAGHSIGIPANFEINY